MSTEEMKRLASIKNPPTRTVPSKRIDMYSYCFPADACALFLGKSRVLDTLSFIYRQCCLTTNATNEKQDNERRRFANKTNLPTSTCWLKPRFLLKQDFMYNKVKSKPYKDICIFLVAHKLKWKGIEPEVHNPYIPISYFV